MGRRIRWMGAIMILCFALILLQLVNIQFKKANALANSPDNPRVEALRFNNDRGTIYAADGTVLAKSVPTSGQYHFTRQYPFGPLYAGITGYDSPYYGAAAGIEEEYDSQLGTHSQGPQTLSQLILDEKPPPTTDDVTLTVNPALQLAAWDALTTLPPGQNKDGAVVVLDPTTGAVLAMVSNPTYDPNALANPDVSEEQTAHFNYSLRDSEGFYPIDPIATQARFAPGSTFKVVTSTAAYNLKPQLDNFDFPTAMCLPFKDSPQHPLCDQGGPCGGTMPTMLPASCDPGYGALGLAEGANVLQTQAELFGYNTVPNIDLPNVVESVFPPIPANSDALLAYSAIGQYDVAATALQNAMVAAGIADGGVIMTPHLMSQIRDSQGNLVSSYLPKPMPRTATQDAAASVTALMEGVATSGTAAGIFPAYLNAAVKTGTAQTQNGLQNTEDWMIGFAPAQDPKVAVAVVVPLQATGATGAGVAGPIMRAVMEAAVPPTSVGPTAPLPANPTTTKPTFATTTTTKPTFATTTTTTTPGR